MTISLKDLGEKVFIGYLYLVVAWVTCALTFMVFMVTVHYFNPPLESKIGNAIMWKIDGTFKNSPDNIWYEKTDTLKSK
jgi:hypothetical protein